MPSDSPYLALPANRARVMRLEMRETYPADYDHEIFAAVGTRHAASARTLGDAADEFAIEGAHVNPSARTRPRWRCDRYRVPARGHPARHSDGRGESKTVASARPIAALRSRRWCIRSPSSDSSSKGPITRGSGNRSFGSRISTRAPRINVRSIAFSILAGAARPRSSCSPRFTRWTKRASRASVPLRRTCSTSCTRRWFHRFNTAIVKGKGAKGPLAERHAACSPLDRDSEEHVEAHFSFVGVSVHPDARWCRFCTTTAGACRSSGTSRQRLRHVRREPGEAHGWLP